MAMLIVEKRRDIGTLRALGADTTLVRSIFRSEGLLICALGAALLFRALSRLSRRPSRRLNYA